jgi:hypothetical protein
LGVMLPFPHRTLPFTDHPHTYTGSKHSSKTSQAISGLARDAVVSPFLCLKQASRNSHLLEAFVVTRLAQGTHLFR